MKINTQLHPNLPELTTFFEEVFTEIADTANFSEENSQDLAEWFSIEEMAAYLPHGTLLEARQDDGALMGALFIGKQNPLTWPDGHKLEIFILGVDAQYRQHGVARQLMAEAEAYAQRVDAHTIIVNTHIAMTTVHSFYEKLGYTRIGTLAGYYENGDAVFFHKRVGEK